MCDPRLLWMLSTDTWGDGWSPPITAKKPDHTIPALRLLLSSLLPGLTQLSTLLSLCLQEVSPASCPFFQYLCNKFHFAYISQHQFLMFATKEPGVNTSPDQTKADRAHSTGSRTVDSCLRASATSLSSPDRSLLCGSIRDGGWVGGWIDELFLYHLSNLLYEPY